MALGKRIAVEGASEEVCKALGIPPEWAQRCEDSFHVGHDGSRDALANRLDLLFKTGNLGRFEDKMQQCASYGGGNHFGEAEAVEIGKDDRAQKIAKTFGLKDNCVAFLSHCGSRGFGYNFAGESPFDQRARAGSVSGNYSGRERRSRLFHQSQHCAKGNCRWPRIVGA